MNKWGWSNRNSRWTSSRMSSCVLASIPFCLFDSIHLSCFENDSEWWIVLHTTPGSVEKQEYTSLPCAFLTSQTASLNKTSHIFPLPTTSHLFCFPPYIVISLLNPQVQSSPSLKEEARHWKLLILHHISFPPLSPRVVLKEHVEGSVDLSVGCWE